ncbi:MAG: hypothetical protein LKJ86_07240 [Oscillibacter sp.]|nr:hypothetical protein [Oscillibacter sp.]
MVLALSVSVGLFRVSAFAGTVENITVSDARQAVLTAEGELVAAPETA